MLPCRKPCSCGHCPLCRARARIKANRVLRDRPAAPAPARPPKCVCGRCRTCRSREATRRWRMRLKRRMWLESVESHIRELFPPYRSTLHPNALYRIVFHSSAHSVCP